MSLNFGHFNGGEWKGYRLRAGSPTRARRKFWRRCCHCVQLVVHSTDSNDVVNDFIGLIKNGLRQINFVPATG